MKKEKIEEFDRLRRKCDIAVSVLNETGFEESAMGVALSYYDESEPLNEWYDKKEESFDRITSELKNMDGGHNKFLEGITVSMLISAPLSWWCHFDTYRTGTTKQSTSTMHCIQKRLSKKNPLRREEFTSTTNDEHISLLQKCINDRHSINEIRDNIPFGYKQVRLVTTNYKTLRNIIMQRRAHKLKYWQDFLVALKSELEHKELLPWQP